MALELIYNAATLKLFSGNKRNDNVKSFKYDIHPRLHHIDDITKKVWEEFENIKGELDTLSEADDLQSVITAGGTYTGSDSINIDTTGSIVTEADTSNLMYGGFSDAVGRGLVTLDPVKSVFRYTYLSQIQQIQFSSSSGMVVTDDRTSKGLVYGGDYEGAFTNRSLVTKAYVDAQIAANDTLQEILDNGSSASISTTFSVIAGSSATSRISLDTTGFLLEYAQPGPIYTFISANPALGHILIQDQIWNKGMVYDADYSGNYTTRSLVDKGYVDGQISAHDLQGVLDIGSVATVSGRAVGATIAHSHTTGDVYGMQIQSTTSGVGRTIGAQILAGGSTDYMYTWAPSDLSLGLIVSSQRTGGGERNTAIVADATTGNDLNIGVLSSVASSGNSAYGFVADILSSPSQNIKGYYAILDGSGGAVSLNSATGFHANLDIKSGDVAENLMGVNSQLKVSDGADWTGGDTITGVLSQVSFKETTTALNELYGFRQITHAGNDPSVTITDAYNFKVEAVTGSGTITNFYGIHLAEQNAGAIITNNWGIYQEDPNAENYFAGNIGVGVAPDFTINVYAREESIATDIFRAETISGGCFFRGDGRTESTDSLTGTFINMSSVGASATGNLFGNHLNMTIDNAVRTIDQVYGFYLENMSTNLNATVNNLYQVYLGTHGNATKGTGDFYGIYQADSTLKNYFAGNIGVGISPSTSSYLRIDSNVESTLYASNQGTGADKHSIKAWTISSNGSKNTGGIFKATNDGTGSVEGIRSEAFIKGTNTSNGQGVYSIFYAQGTGTITSSESFYGSFDVDSGKRVQKSSVFRSLGVSGSGTSDNSYHIYLDAHSTGTNKYGIYQVGSSDSNYFAGNTGIGIAPDSARELNVASTLGTTIYSSHTGNNSTNTGIRSTVVTGVSNTDAYGVYSDVTTTSGGNAYGGYFYAKGSASTATGVYSRVGGLSVTGASYGAYNLVLFDGALTSGGSMYGTAGVVTISTTGAHGASVFGVTSDINYQKSGGTLTNAYGFYHTGVLSDTGATITNAYGLYLGDNTGAGTITNSYGVYQAGADDQNYFAGAVGIGTTSPAAVLEVEAATSTLRLDSTTTTNNSQLLFINSADSLYATIQNDGNDLVFGTQGAERCRISGNTFGIGTANPQVELHVKGTGATLRLETTSATGNNFLEYYDTVGSKGYIGYGSGVNDNLIISNTESAGGFQILTDATNALYINSSQQVGIGTTSIDTNVKLQVEGSGGTKLKIEDTSTTASLEIHSDTITDNAKWAIAVDPTSTKEFQIYDLNHGTSPGDERFSIDANGGVQVSTTLGVGMDPVAGSVLSLATTTNNLEFIESVYNTGLTTAASTLDGYIKVEIGGNVMYINAYSNIPT